MIYQVAVAVVLAATVAANTYTSDPQTQKFLWESFKKSYRRKYETMDEENFRFETFVNNLKSIDERNAKEIKKGGTAVHGITKFSDLSQAEFQSRYLLSDVSKKSGDAKLDTTVRTLDTAAGLVDWSGKLTTDVKDQVCNLLFICLRTVFIINAF